MMKFIKIQPGYKNYRIRDPHIVEIMEFDPTQVSVFLMPMMGSGFFITAPPEATNPLDYTDGERQSYQGFLTIKRLPV